MPRPTGPARVRSGGLAIAIVITSTLASCGGGQDDAELAPGSSAVTFTSADGVTLEGRLFGQGSTAVVLSHMLPADQRSWFDFAERLADQGFLVLTYDFRGYCPGGAGGCSKGERDVSSIWQDVLGAMDLVRSRGATTVALIGASMGGTASLVAAAQAQADADVIVTLSAPVAVEGLVAGPEVLQRVPANKLFVAGVGDASAAASAEELYATAPPPKRLEIVPADDHGTDLLTGPQGEVVRRAIETYLAQFAPA